MCTAVVVFAEEDDTELLPGVVFKVGDVNLDTKVNIKDASLIQKHLAKITTLADNQLDIADVDGKKGVSIKDATHLQKWLAGIVDELFAPKSTEPAEEPTEVPTEVTTEITEAPTEEYTEATLPTEEPFVTLPEVLPETLPETLPEIESTKDEHKPIELPFVPAV